MFDKIAGYLTKKGELLCPTCAGNEVTKYVPVHENTPISYDQCDGCNTVLCVEQQQITQDWVTAFDKPLAPYVVRRCREPAKHPIDRVAWDGTPICRYGHRG